MSKVLAQRNVWDYAVDTSTRVGPRLKRAADSAETSIIDLRSDFGSPVRWNQGWPSQSPRLLSSSSSPSVAGHGREVGILGQHDFLEGDAATGPQIIDLLNSPAFSDLLTAECLAEQISGLFVSARPYHFTDGMQGPFSVELERLVRLYGNEAVMTTADLVLGADCPGNVAAEALLWIGRLDHPPTYSTRLWLLEQALRHSEPAVRDAAGLGLAAMDDPHALPYLRRAVDQEAIPALKGDLQLVVEQLEETEQCQTW